MESRPMRTAVSISSDSLAPSLLPIFRKKWCPRRKERFERKKPDHLAARYAQTVGLGLGGLSNTV